MNAKLLAFGILICFLSTTAAVDLEYNLIISGLDVSLVKGHMNYQSVTNDIVSKHEQHIYSVDQATFDYDSTAFFSDNHDISIETNLSGTRSTGSGIGGTDYIKNVGLDDSKSCCVFGIAGSGHNLTVASIIGLQPTSLTQTYVIEATQGEVGTGYVKATENITVKGKQWLRGKEAFTAGQRTCTKAPESHVGKEEGKPSYCVFPDGSAAFPVFTQRRGNETALGYNYYVRRGNIIA